MRKVFIFLVALLLFALPLSAQEVVTADDINEIAKGLYCPVCESEPLDTCGTQACIDWREEIGVQLEAGMTQDEIYDSFVTRYGPGVLAQPPARGFTLLLWLGLPVGLLVGGFFFYRYLQDIRSPSPDKAVIKSSASLNGHHAQSDSSYLRKIEQELDDE